MHLLKWKPWVTVLLLTLSVSVSASAKTAANITDRCKLTVSEGKTDYLLDSKVNTTWSPKAENAEICIRLPKCGAGYVQIKWMDSPAEYDFIQYDEDRNEITACNEERAFNAIIQVFEIDPDARYLTLRLIDSGQRICTVRVYSKGEKPDTFQEWEAPYEKCDLMVFSAHQDDEWIFFGGILPYYERVQHKKVQLVYMADCGRVRYSEALNGLWVSGERNYPDFVGLKDERITSLDHSLEDWGGEENILSLMVERIRKYRPEVILTHDLNGEYGHNQHRITAQEMQDAIDAAANPEMFPESNQKYGAWQVKKLYLHLYAANVIDFDWNQKYAELDNRTPLDVARTAFNEYPSQQGRYSVLDGGRFDNSLFGLAFSTVGEDVNHNDFFENIPEDAEGMLVVQDQINQKGDPL